MEVREQLEKASSPMRDGDDAGGKGDGAGGEGGAAVEGVVADGDEAAREIDRESCVEITTERESRACVREGPAADGGEALRHDGVPLRVGWRPCHGPKVDGQHG